MFNTINPRQMEKMMKQMGIKSEEIAAKEVIIKALGRDIIIVNPKVTKIKIGGQDTFQIIGEVSERKFSAEDIKMVAEQTGKSMEEARKILEETDGNIAESIMKFKGK